MTTTETECLTQAKAGVQLSSLIAHVRENNLAYLLGVYIAHSMGLLTQVSSHAAGICS